MSTSASERSRFEDSRLAKMSKYVYDALPPKTIRLMRLRSGHRDDPIECELFEAAYDNSFHIPTHVSREWENKRYREPERPLQTGAAHELGEVKESLKALMQKMKEMKEMKKTEKRKRTPDDTWDKGAIEEMRATEEEIRATEEEMRTMEKGKDLLKTQFEELRRGILEHELEAVEKIEIEYEALSWCWGQNTSDYAIHVTKGNRDYKMLVRSDLALALKYLRKQAKRRVLWIDAISIDQENDVERNQQVQMMSRIYTRAANVCIWLGPQDKESEVAFKFIKEVTHLNDFDSISSDKDYSSKWQALMVLMQREWFSRRWVVQELSLANKAEIWCGSDSMPWKEFAVAVELFVEVESATHRLSEVVQKDVQFRHVPGWFEYVSQLGASLLVQATGKVFRSYGTPMDKDKVDDKDIDENMTDEEKATKEEKDEKKAANEKHNQRAKSLNSIQTIDPLDRRSLLSLEYLVTTMFIFKASECRDSVYSMLAIARDAAPFASDTTSHTKDVVPVTTDAIPVTKPIDPINDVDLPFLLLLFRGFLAEKPFLIDYTRPYSDVCRDFMEFCIERKSALDPVQALDILCRPWALEPQRGGSARVKKRKRSSADRIGKGAKRTDVRREARQEQDLEDFWKGNIDGEESEVIWRRELRELLIYSRRRRLHEKKALMDDMTTVRDAEETEEKEYDDNIEQSKDIDLPSWVPRAKNAPFEIYRQPGIDIAKTGRVNADPLVGWPQDGHRNYSAAQTEAVKLDYLKFKKRYHMGHYSLYVTGFKVDEVGEVRDASQGGSIPKSWLELSGWEPPYTQDPPADFWRTIVADRGSDNRNPPYYYARACRESVVKGGWQSGIVDTAALINVERNSIIAEFCRRVHAVIWGRSLFKTKSGKLGLGKNVRTGDLVCILHGCTVPVILAAEGKKEGDKAKESFEDSCQALKACVQRLEEIHVCRRRYKKQKEKYRTQEGDLTSESSWEQDVRFAHNKVNVVLRKDEKRRKAFEQQKPTKQRFKLDEDKFYVFKGEGYVHGCMDGEAVRERFYGTEQEWIYELR